MATTKAFYSFASDLKIIEAKNIESKLKGNLFVRYYLPSGFNKKASIVLNTREIPAKNDQVWNEFFSLECRGLDKLIRQDKLVFELRLRNVVPLIGTMFGGSKLLGRAEIPLEEVLKSPNMVFDKWLALDSTCAHMKDGVESPKALRVEIKVRVSAEVMEKKRGDFRNVRRNMDICGCRDCPHNQYACTNDDYDVFALVAALEAF